MDKFFDKETVKVLVIAGIIALVCLGILLALAEMTLFFVALGAVFALVGVVAGYAISWKKR